MTALKQRLFGGLKAWRKSFAIGRQFRLLIPDQVLISAPCLTKTKSTRPMSIQQNVGQKSQQKPRPAQGVNLDALYKPVGIQAVSAASICKKSAK